MLTNDRDEKQSPLLGPQSQKLIDLGAAFSDRPYGWLASGVATPLEKFLAIRRINAIFQQMPQGLEAGDFCRHSLGALDVDYALTEQEMAAIPAGGPLVVVANHPFGGLEGIILADILLRCRSDIRILGNHLLRRIPQLRSKIIPLDVFNPRNAAMSNAGALRRAMDWLAQQGVLLTFPAGEVSHWQARAARAIDAPWSPHIAGMIRRSKAKVLPVFIHGRNSLLFNLLGMIHPRLRTVLLPREMVNKQSTTVALTVGKPISWQRLAEFGSDREAMDFLRFSTYILQHRKEFAMRRRFFALPTSKAGAASPIVAPVYAGRLMDEIKNLPQGDCLVAQKQFRVYMTTADQSPAIMREIGRLREASFRNAGEGTGRSLDIDAYDAHYRHLFLWNEETREIVGAYRLGQTDCILASVGPKGLYSTTLFNYKPALLAHLGCALELGRSFIRTEYQKKFGCLALLWRGIGEFVARNNRYHLLFGPVSISESYHHISKNLMVTFLHRHSMASDLSAFVKPRQPVRIAKYPQGRHAGFPSVATPSLDDISMLVEEIEQDRKGVPTLIKHYLKLNGRFLAFNRDKAFSNVIDGLVLVDLLKSEPKILGRFLGKQGLEVFYAHHNR